MRGPTERVADITATSRLDTGEATIALAALDNGDVSELIRLLREDGYPVDTTYGRTVYQVFRDAVRDGTTSRVVAELASAFDDAADQAETERGAGTPEVEFARWVVTTLRGIEAHRPGDTTYVVRPRRVNAIRIRPEGDVLRTLTLILPPGWNASPIDAHGATILRGPLRSTVVPAGDWVVVDGATVRAYTTTEFTATYRPSTVTYP